MENDEDIYLWEALKNSTHPLGSSKYIHKDYASNRVQFNVENPEYKKPPYSDFKIYNVNNYIDKNILKKIAKGTIPIERKIDLHGMTKQEAHAILKINIYESYLKYLRTLLIITGKGREGEGVLKKLVPNFLEMEDFSYMVSSYNIASKDHGGSGALYVRLRKRK